MKCLTTFDYTVYDSRKNMKLSMLFAAGTMFAGIAAAQAAPIVYFGEDINTGGDPSTVSPTHSTVTRNAFFTNLVGVGTENFDSIAVNTGTPLPISFGAAGTATITGSGNVAAGNDDAGRYPVSGTQYYLAGAGNFAIGFSAPIAALGFYGIDVGDFGGQLTLTLVDVHNVSTTLTVPNTLGSGGSTSGSILYFGFYDTTDTYKSVSFGNNSGGADTFAFDNFSIGSRQQVVPTPTPEPGSMTLLLAGLAGFGLIRRRKA
jgi:hypothetical protein